jgi:hypothetical protein
MNLGHQSLLQAAFLPIWCCLSAALPTQLLLSTLERKSSVRRPRTLTRPPSRVHPKPESCVRRVRTVMKPLAGTLVTTPRRQGTAKIERRVQYRQSSQNTNPTVDISLTGRREAIRKRNQQRSLAIRRTMVIFLMVVISLKHPPRRKNHSFVSVRALPRPHGRRRRALLRLLFLPYHQHLYQFRTTWRAVPSPSTGTKAHLCGLHWTNPQT